MAMRRRALIVTSGSVLAMADRAGAQRMGGPVVGYLHFGSPGPQAQEVTAFRAGLKDAGFTEGTNVTVEYRWAEGRQDRVPALAAELVQRRVDVIVAIGGNAALAAIHATSTIPIVFQIGVDPVQTGLVKSLAGPNGNVTGLSLFFHAVEAKRLALLYEFVPGARQIAVLVDPVSIFIERRVSELREAAQGMGLQLPALEIRVDSELEPAFARIAALGYDGLFVSASPFFDRQRDRIVALAARFGVPTSYPFRDYTAAGGLMSYGTSLLGVARQTAGYVARILKGVKPGELPVLQPTTFELVINLVTARALGLSIPNSLLARADEVIE